MTIGTTIPSAPSTRHRLLQLRWGDAWQLVVVAVSYFVAAEAAFSIGTLSDRIFTPFWPPNIVLLCALVLTPSPRWWIPILAAFPAHVIVEFGVGMSAAQMLVAFATNCLFAMTSAGGIRRFVGPPPWFTTLRGSSVYMLIAGLLSPALIAFTGAFVPILGGGASDRYWTFWAQWYAANALGSLTFGPIALIALIEWRPFSIATLSFRRGVEAASLTMALVAVCAITFEVSADNVTRSSIPALIYSPLPLIIWAAVRFGATGASAAVLTMTVVLMSLTLNGPSIFTSGDVEPKVFSLQIFLIGLSALVLILGASIDQTRRAETVTRESEARMALAAAAANVGIWHYNLRRNDFWMTEHCRAMFDIAKNEAVTNGTITRVVHPDDRETAIGALRTSNLTKRSVRTEFRVILADRNVRWYLAHAQVDVNSDGEPTKISGVVSDITDRKEADAEAALQRNEIAHLMRVAMLGELSGGIAHELTQPITAILSNAQAARAMLANKRWQRGELAEIIDDIIFDDNRASEIIQRLRCLFRKGDATVDSVDVNALIAAVLRLLHSELINLKLDIAVTTAPELPVILGDGVQLQQVLLNLILNAVESMNGAAGSARQIDIRTSRTSTGSIEVSIRDRGAGIAEAQIEKIFMPFFTTKERGLGLGLSICQSIIQSHGGVLHLNNNADGGATARFVVPSHDSTERVL